MPQVGMGIDVDYRVTINSNIPKYLEELNKACYDAVLFGGRHYRNELRKALRKTEGSVAVSGDKRLRVRHSPSGQLPYAQTFNLANSIHLQIPKLGKAFEYSAHVYSPVKYAYTLEHGGIYSMHPRYKRFTRWRLLNPLLTKKYIAPRPAFSIVWNSNINFMEYRMFGIINKVNRKYS